MIDHSNNLKMILKKVEKSWKKLKKAKKINKKFEKSCLWICWKKSLNNLKVIMKKVEKRKKSTKILKKSCLSLNDLLKKKFIKFNKII